MISNKVFATLITIGLSLGFLKAQNNKNKVDFSFRLAPTISISGVNDESRNWDFEKGAAKMKFNGGLSFDINLQENVSFSTGIWYTGKRSVMNISADTLSNPTGKEVIDYSLNYIEVPLLFKGYTNNLTDKMKLYLNIGGVFGFKISETYVGDENQRPLQSYPDGENVSKKYAGFFDASLLTGAGVEFNIGTSNKVYFGLDYSLGLVNIIHKDFISSLSRKGDIDIEKGTNYAVKNNYLAFVTGFKF